MREELLSRLRDRIDFQIRCEVESDIEGWIATIDPQLRAGRQERDDLSKPEGWRFMDRVKAARVTGVRVKEWEPGVEHPLGRPCALVETKVLYGDYSEPTVFSTPWVLDEGVWYTRAVGKLRFSRSRGSLD